MDSATTEYDLLVVGGGINGAGIARDAAGRGLKVLLVERDDLAAHTSSASTKLVHGGLRYLEHGAFRLVRKALIERERLLDTAPHVIRPLEFVIPQTGGGRPAWLVRLGLMIYDRLGGMSRLPRTRVVSLCDGRYADGLSDGPRKGFAYWDCWVDDSRLVVLNAVDAAARGAVILTRTELCAAARSGGHWDAVLRGEGGVKQVRARALVNAAGPWVGEMIGRLGTRSKRSVRLVKGSHIVLPRLFTGEHAFLIQNPDGRVVFAIPYEGEHTLIGTTDVGWEGAPKEAKISDGEVAYLLETVARNFARKVAEADVVWSYSGIRPLLDDGTKNASAVTRDYVLELDDEGPPLLTVFGGKITTYRLLAEHALARLARYFPAMTGDWTHGAPLPGGALRGSLSDYLAHLRTTYPTLPTRLLGRLGRSYGTDAERLLGDAQTLDDLGETFGAGLTAREVDYLIDHEWALSAQDILFRRSKLGIHMDEAAVAKVKAHVQRRLKDGS
jgi:glycerol-3-phosphate dehydrogenase